MIDEQNSKLLVFFSALSDANRLKIVGLLSQDDFSVEELAEMLAEGFVRSRHVDIFDAGPIVKAERERLETFRRAAWHPVRIRPEHALPDAEPAMIANQTLSDFRCIVARYALSPTGQLMLSPQHAERLGVEEGRAVLAAPLSLPSAVDALDEGEM